MAERRVPSANENLPRIFDSSQAIRNIRRLIWLYLWLLIFEGAFRKWIVPQLSAPLLLIRDPVVILIYLLALRAKVFPHNIYVICLEVLAILSWATGIIVLLPYFPIQSIVLVTGYGVRSDFLHLPLIFIIPAVFTLEDVKRIGWWTIVGMMPMAVLMALQFAASPEAFINRAAGVGEGTQLAAGGGKIRPPGTFSFVSGSVYYASAAAAFLLHAVLAKLPYRNLLLYASGAGLIVSLGVSGSRSAVLAVVVVVAGLGVIMLLRPSIVNKFGRHLFFAVILLVAVSYLPIFREGLGILSDRFTESADEESVVGGLVGRTVGGFTEGLLVIDRVPLGGYGLGVGTSGGASFLTGQASFLLAENEWSRILLESGPILGLAFLIWRSALTFKLGFFAFRQVREGNSLPIFLFMAGLFVVLQGPFGQPTSLGFAVVFAGLCLAARPRELMETVEPAEPADASAPPRVRGRSKYAERLHGSIHRSHSVHGPLDR
ncbi:MAG: hypothetical protein M3Q46_06095 [Verrucomicrobiota bacterium]|nr:hypothetical protein [Verrucomicrobiota bacterium]